MINASHHIHVDRQQMGTDHIDEDIQRISEMIEITICIEPVYWSMKTTNHRISKCDVQFIWYLWDRFLRSSIFIVQEDWNLLITLSRKTTKTDRERERQVKTWIRSTVHKVYKEPPKIHCGEQTETDEIRIIEWKYYMDDQMGPNGTIKSCEK